jgi:uncharacterized protein YbjT (DUF2867 family)
MHREPHTARNSGAAEATGVLGATSFVGQSVLARLQASRLQISRLQASALDESAATTATSVASPVFAFSRQSRPTAATIAAAGIHWQHLPVSPGAWHASIPQWIAVCPLWAVPEHFALLESAGARRLVALSSTSRFTKRDSAAAAERAIAARLVAAEEEVLDWAQTRGIAATILRPTLIYDGIHQAAIGCDGLRDTYEISGGETLPYHEMVRRIFAWLGRPPRLAGIPLPLVRAALPVANLMPGLASMATMAVRMNEDMAFDHAAAARDFGFQPRSFALPLRSVSNHAASIPR